MRSRLSGLPVPLAAALGALLLGLLLIVIGFARSGGAADGSATSTKQMTTEAPLLVIGPGQLGPGSAKLSLKATGAAGSPVFLGAARTEDVQAFLGEAPWAGLTGDGEVEIREYPGVGRAGDPRRSDIWVVQSAGTAEASLDWPTTPGRWSLVAAGDGSAAAPTVQLTWNHPATRSGARWWWLGGVPTVAGLLGLALLRGLIPLPPRRPAARPARFEAATETAPAPRVTSEDTQILTRVSEETRSLPRVAAPETPVQPRTRAEARARLRGRSGISATPAPAPGIAAGPVADAPPAPAPPAVPATAPATAPLPALPPPMEPPPPPDESAEDSADDEDSPSAVLPFRRSRRSQP